jgi:hypothetical protein
MHRTLASLIRLLLGAVLVLAVLAPAPAWAGHHRCVISETDTAGGDDSVSGGEVTTETSVACPTTQTGGEGEAGGTGDDDAGVGGVGRIDAGAGATAAAGSASLAPWALLAGAGAAGSLLRRRRR